MDTIGFIGLGHMGQPMVRNLLKAGFTVYVYDIVEAAVKKMVNEGAHAVNTFSSMAKKCDVIITSVQTSQQVIDVCLGVDGIFAQAKSNLLYVDCSSIDVAATQLLHREAEKLRISMVDAPVSGGVSGAKAASLTVMVGGSISDYQRALPILQILGKKIVHAGEAGHGQAAKICNNLLLAISMIGVSEAFNLATKLGLDPKTFFEISAHSSGQCWAMTSYCPVPGILENTPSSNDYRPGFMAKMMLKDLRLAQHAAESVSAAIPLGALSTELYELYVNQGFGEIDFSGIIHLIAEKAH